MYFEVKTPEEKRNFYVITNQLLYQLSYAGVHLEAPYAMRIGTKFQMKISWMIRI
ncbi:MAG TPA: hypothetical protein VJ521_04240 [Acidobacteriota bacterium]|nr:hypothetical protein [Acidobacteriota bacterium]